MKKKDREIVVVSVICLFVFGAIYQSSLFDTIMFSCAVTGLYIMVRGRLISFIDKSERDDEKRKDVAES